MIATAHPISEVLGELLAQYEARGLLAEVSASVQAASPLKERNRVSAPLWAGKPGLEAALSTCGQFS